MPKKALIDGSKIVQNIIEYAERGISGRFPADCNLIECTGIPVAIGDEYRDDGNFYRGGVPVERIPTDAEKIEELRAALAALMEG